MFSMDLPRITERDAEKANPPCQVTGMRAQQLVRMSVNLTFCLNNTADVRPPPESQIRRKLCRAERGTVKERTLSMDVGNMVNKPTTTALKK